MTKIKNLDADLKVCSTRTSRMHQSWGTTQFQIASRRVLDFLDHDDRDPFIVAIQVADRPSAEDVCHLLRSQVLVIVEEAFLQFLAEGQTPEQRMQRLPLSREQQRDVELIGRLGGPFDFERREALDRHHRCLLYTSPS